MVSEIALHQAGFSELDTTTLYRILKMRSDVFIAEQKESYPELDGRDLEPETVHLWYAQDNKPVAYLRILEEADGSARIGRVVVVAEMRGSGLGQALMTVALERIGNRRCVLHAQAHQTDFYARFGFTVVGTPRANSRIPHVSMVRLPEDS